MHHACLAVVVLAALPTYGLAAPLAPHDRGPPDVITLPAGFVAPGRARFEARGARLGAPGESIGFVFESWGRSGEPDVVQRVEPRLNRAEPTPDEVRIEYARPGITEWWRITGTGFQQGWTIDSRPAGVDPLELTVSVLGAHPRETDGLEGLVLQGRDAPWRYQHVIAWDADGRLLDADVEAIEGRIRVIVDDADARYPIIVDPNIDPPARILTTDDVNDDFGSQMAAGDFNDDGFVDLAVSAPFALDADAMPSGKVHIYLGRDVRDGGPEVEPAYTLDQIEDGAFGFHMVAGNFQDGDADELVISGGEGTVWVYGYDFESGEPSAPREVDDLPQLEALFNGGDLDDNGFDELVMRYSEFTLPCQDQSEATTSGLKILYGEEQGLNEGREFDVVQEPDEQIACECASTNELLPIVERYCGFGVAVLGGHDINGDDIDDLLVGAPGIGRQGTVYSYAGSVGGLFQRPFNTLDGVGEGRTGRAIAVIDGAGENPGLHVLLIGGGGVVQVHSTADDGIAAEPIAIGGFDTLQKPGARTGDIDGDGQLDLLVYETDEGIGRGEFGVYYGPIALPPGGPDFPVTGTFQGENLGYRSLIVGDMNGNGFAEVAAAFKSADGPGLETEIKLLVDVFRNGAILDRDGDGWFDDQDNCIEIFNPEQSDRDGDFRGDLCDVCPDGGRFVEGRDECASFSIRGFDGSRSLCVEGGQFGLDFAMEYEPFRQLAATLAYDVEQGVELLDGATALTTDVFFVGDVGALSGPDICSLERFVEHGGAVLETRDLDRTIFGVSRDAELADGGGICAAFNGGPEVSLCDGVEVVQHGSASGLAAGALANTILTSFDDDRNQSAVALAIGGDANVAGRAVIVGDEEVFLAIGSCGRLGFGFNEDNQDFLYNSLEWLQNAPGFDPEAADRIDECFAGPVMSEILPQLLAPGELSAVSAFEVSDAVTPAAEIGLRTTSSDRAVALPPTVEQSGEGIYTFQVRAVGPGRTTVSVIATDGDDIETEQVIDVFVGCEVDTDLDGLCNDEDPDDDNDGWTDDEESERGTDPLNPDSDEDGVNDPGDNCPLLPNPRQANLDFDDLGNVCDPDTDGDGLSNELEDETGTNRESNDSDADGIRDGVEDRNLNGVIDDGETDPRVRDSDGDGLIDGVEDANMNGVVDANETDPLQLDSDFDQILDGIEDANLNGQVDPGETDPRNPDSDRDRILDGLEDANANGERDPGETDPLLQDSDGDGIGDGVEDANWNGRLDDGETDPRERDSDSDEIDDGSEDANLNGQVDPGETDPRLADTDDDGLEDGVEDADRNREVGPDETDPLDEDTDDDGILDGVEDADRSGDFGPDETDPRNPDTDGDGIADGLEDANRNGLYEPGETDPRVIDSDQDGLPDGLEDTNRNGIYEPGETDPRDFDTDQDGLEDGLEDADLNGEVGPDETDPRDPDTDGDGLEDGDEDEDGDGAVGPDETDPRNPDTDEDGLSDGIEDTDRNGVVDPGETDPRNADTDGDFIPDGVEDANRDGLLDPGETDPRLWDTDADEVDDNLDNCPRESNPGQEDTDDDGIGDACTDTDADGISDDDDNCRVRPNPDQADADSDGHGDICDACPNGPGHIDSDGDDICDVADSCPDDPDPNQNDYDGDRLGDPCDPDQDNDGVLNDDDVEPLNPSRCQDLDGDTCDDCALGTDQQGPEDDYDPDNDGPDADGDGICDAGEQCGDRDGDGVCDDDDNCKDTINPEQADTDEDGTGDACEPPDGDLDEDGLSDDRERMLGTKIDDPDTDDDTFDDYLEVEVLGTDPLTPNVDSDGDRWPDAVDNCQFVPNPDQDDTDADQTGDACDLDDGNEDEQDVHGLQLQGGCAVTPAAPSGPSSGWALLLLAAMGLGRRRLRRGSAPRG